MIPNPSLDCSYAVRVFSFLSFHITENIYFKNGDEDVQSIPIVKR